MLIAFSMSALIACGGPVRKSLPEGAPSDALEAAKSCDRRDMEACSRLALMYWQGTTMERDVDRAVPLFQIACAGGVPEACTTSEEVAMPQGASSQHAELARRCDRRDAGACTALASAYRDGVGVPVDVDHAVRLFGRTCSAGHEAACYGTEETMLPHSVDPEVLRLARGCDRADGAMCRILGDTYRSGERIGSDAASMARAYEKACRLGHTETCDLFGRLLMEGEQVAFDPDRAVPMLRIACNAGSREACSASEELFLPRTADDSTQAAAVACDRRDADACVVLGVAYAEGQGIPPNATRAAGIFERTCERGSSTACLHLGLLRIAGQGGSTDAIEGARLLEHACESGELLGCFELGSLYRHGTGVPRNVELAIELWNRACQGGMQRACDEMPGRAEAALPSRASEVHRTLARRCDEGNLVPCMELANHYVNGTGIPQDWTAANHLLTRACFGGVHDACPIVHFPGPCVEEETDASGRVLDRRQHTYNLTALARDGFAESTGETTTAPRLSSDGALVRLPTTSAGARLPEPDARAGLTWDTARLQRSYPPGHTVAYDDDTRIAIVTDPSGAEARMTFDATGRLSQLIERPSGPNTTTFTYRFNADGRLVETREVRGSASTETIYAYDQMGRVIAATRASETQRGTDTVLYTYAYDQRGLLTEMIVETRTALAGAAPQVTEYRQHRVIRDRGGNPMRSDVRDQNRVVLSATNYTYDCFGVPSN